MTREELSELVAEVRRLQGELQDVEVKAARRDTPKRLFEPVSAFANRAGGGVLLFGLDEERDFELVGVGNVQKLQEDIAHLTSELMEPVLRPEINADKIEGKVVVAVEVPEAPAVARPCYYRTAGMQGGSYIRVGNSNRRMTDYEIFGYVSAREQPRFDQEPVEGSTADDLDLAQLEAFVARLRRDRPGASYLNHPLDAVLNQLKITRDVDGVVRPTLAGLLMFGKYPQGQEPQLVITFVQYYGTTETEMAPGGRRFVDNQKFEGTVPEVVEGAVNRVLANLRSSSLIEGLWRRDIPEYPEVAVREAVINAVAHRDYSRYVRGSHIRIKLFADRLEIQSPGGLYGNVTVETLEQQQSARNATLVRLMEDVRLVENRGSGISTMIEEMQRANLEPPRFKDNRTSFLVIFRNHTLMSPDAIAWLARFAGHRLNDGQRLALVYARTNESITNEEYRRLLRTDPGTAYKELRGLVDLGLLAPRGMGRWTSYTLNVSAESPPTAVEQADEERVLAYVRERGSIARAEAVRVLGLSDNRARYILQKLTRNGALRQEGPTRRSRYTLP